MWLKVENLRKLVQDRLKNHGGSEQLDVQQMLREMKKVIKDWNSTQNGNIFSRLADAELELDKA